MHNIPDKKDFYFIFQSRGTTFLFEDLVATHYLFGQSITFSRKGTKQVYLANSLMKKISAQGMASTVSHTRRKINSLRKSIVKAKEQAISYRNKRQLGKTDVGIIFKLLASIMED